MMNTIDLNADLGEGMLFDAQLMPLLSSCNIACGVHAGDEATMITTLRLAKNYGVSVGAHPSYPDRANFGRVAMPLSATEISEIVCSQVQTLLDLAQQEQVKMCYVKPHGALYNVAARDFEVAQAIVAGIKTCDASLMVMGLAHSELTNAAQQAGLTPIHEAFIDRMYESDGTLRDRTLPNAIHHDQAVALEQALNIAQQQAIRCYDGTRLLLQADSLCLHGDTPHALEFAQIVHTAFTNANIRIASATK